MKMLAVLVSFTKSRCAYAVLAAQFPRKMPSSCVTERSPELSNANTLLARSVAEIVKSVVVIVLAFDALIDRPISSSCVCTMKVSLSKLASKLPAGKGSFGTKSKPCKLGCTRRIVRVVPLAGAVPIVTLPPDASPTPLTV